MADDEASPESRKQRHARMVRAIFAVLALLSLLCALVFYLLAERLGVEETTVGLITTAFLVAAVLDALVLYAWDRLFRPQL
jgi:high-affinity Fe2+/Pb2+ permease